MKVATWNVNGIRARKDQVEDWVARVRPDILCLQEIKAEPAQVPERLCAMQGYWCYWHGGKGYSGVGLHVSRALSPERPQFGHPAYDHEHRIVEAVLEVPGFGPLTVASIYVPNGGKDYPAKVRFLEAMVAHARELRQRNAGVLLCGDFNVTRTERDVHPRDRNPHSIGQLPEERRLIERLLDEDLVDLGRDADPDNDSLYTWWAPWRNMRERNLGWRLDYICASGSLHRRLRSCVVHREVGTSDHGPVVATFDLGPG